MYIMVVGRGYPSEKYRMNGIFEYDQARALAQAGHKVVFLAVDVRSIKKKRKFGRESFTRDGVALEIMNIPFGPVLPKLRERVTERAVSKLFRDAVKKHGMPDVIHAHFATAAGVAFRALSDVPVKKVVTEHFSKIMGRSPLTDTETAQIRYAYDSTDRIIAVSGALKEAIRACFSKEALVIPNVVELDAFKGCTPEAHEGFSVVSACGFVPSKNMSLLVRAFAKAADADSHLYLCGDGAMMGEVRTIIGELGVADKVTLTGFVGRSEIASIMQKCDCFALPSRLETFGVVYIEAMAAGLPVVATRCGGPEEFVNEKNGVLIPVDDEAALVEALTYMKEHSGEFDRARIMRETEEKFSPAAIAARLTELYDELLHEV